MKCEIVQITPALYDCCGNIWDMEHPHAQKWLEEIEEGVRIPFAYVENGLFVGEGALVLKNSDPHYTIFCQRVYLSRLIVKKECRGRGIGKILVNYLCEKAKAMGYSEISVGVDKDNVAALHLYRSKGFTHVLYEGEDQYGPFFKLLKYL